jgi:hypothetical protein
VLNTLIRYAEEQGLLVKKITVDDLFIQIDEPNGNVLLHTV